MLQDYLIRWSPCRTQPWKGDDQSAAGCSRSTEIGPCATHSGLAAQLKQMLLPTQAAGTHNAGLPPGEKPGVCQNKVHEASLEGTVTVEAVHVHHQLMQVGHRAGSSIEIEHVSSKLEQLSLAQCCHIHSENSEFAHMHPTPSRGARLGPNLPAGPNLGHSRTLHGCTAPPEHPVPIFWDPAAS